MIVVLLAVFFALVLPFLQQSAAQPSITVSNPQYSAPGCFFSSSQEVTFTMTLVNAGSAAGVAVVTFYADGGSLGSQQYTILEHSSQSISASFTINDCNTYTYEYALTSVTKT